MGKDTVETVQPNTPGGRFVAGCIIGACIVTVWMAFDSELDIQSPWTYACVGFFSLIAGAAYDWYKNAVEAVSFSAGIMLVTFFAYCFQMGLNNGSKHMATGIIILHLGCLLRRQLSKKSL